MKKFLTRIFRAAAFPLAWCYGVIREAPVISFQNEWIGFTDFNDFLTPEEGCSSHFKATACKVSSSGR